MASQMAASSRLTDSMSHSAAVSVTTSADRSRAGVAVVVGFAMPATISTVRERADRQSDLARAPDRVS